MGRNDQKNVSSSTNEKKQREKLARREAKAMKSLDDARRAVKRIEGKLQKRQENLLAREMKLERIRATSVTVADADTAQDTASSEVSENGAHAAQPEEVVDPTFNPAETLLVETILAEIAPDLAEADLAASSESDETEQDSFPTDLAAAMVQDTLEATEQSPSEDISDAELIAAIIQDTDEAELMVVDLQVALEGTGRGNAAEPAETLPEANEPSEAKEVSVPTDSTEAEETAGSPVTEETVTEEPHEPAAPPVTEESITEEPAGTEESIPAESEETSGPVAEEGSLSVASGATENSTEH